MNVLDHQSNNLSVHHIARPESDKRQRVSFTLQLSTIIMYETHRLPTSGTRRSNNPVIVRVVVEIPTKTARSALR